MQTQQQGEVRIEKIDNLPEGLVAFDQKTPDGNWIISHSEKGHHHCLPGDGVTVMERKLPAEFGDAMSILYAIVDRPVEMFQDAAVPHETAVMEPGIYELTVSAEVDPFTKKARRVAD